MANEMIDRRRNDMFDAMNDWFGFPKNFFDDNKISDMMQSDVTENDKEYTVKIDMPGLKKDEIKLNYSNNVLTVSSNRKTIKDLNNEKDNVIHQERSEGHVSRSYRFPNVVANKIHAKYDNGVLTINLPKQTADSNNSSIQID